MPVLVTKSRHMSWFKATISLVDVQRTTEHMGLEIYRLGCNGSSIEENRLRMGWKETTEKVYFSFCSQYIQGALFIFLDF